MAFSVKERVAVDDEALVAASDLGLASRQRHVEALHLEHGEALAHRVDGAEAGQQRLDVVWRQAEHLEVEVLGGLAQQPVADEAADDERPAAARVHIVGNGAGEIEFRQGHR
jgi:hypothetical protein